MITIIIPLRLSETALYDEMERLQRISHSIPRNDFSVMIVDFGTSEARMQDLKAFSADHPDIRIVRGGNPDQPFSIGEARDVGVLSATTPVIMLHDLDFLCETETYRDIASEVALRKLDRQGYDFLCVPTIFLTEEGSSRYLAVHNKGNRREADRFIHNEALRNQKNEYVEHSAIGSSALIANRYFYLTSGGHDRNFVGHGAEDFEFYNRLTDLGKRAGRPPRYTENIPVELGKWEGFRSFFSLYGMDLWMRGTCLVHLNHPRREKVDEIYRKSSYNFSLLKTRLVDFSKNKKHLPPFGDPRAKTKTLVLVDPDSLAANSLQNVFPALGNYMMLGENLFENPQLLIEYCKDESFDAILFLNPYGNEHRLNLYTEATRKGIKCYAHDRGALNDSWFFDDSGFLGTSFRYNEEYWNAPLSTDVSDQTKKWIQNYINAGNTLEANGERKNSDFWKNALGASGRKIIFVALQRPGDTATRFFAGPAGTYPNFLEWVKELSKNLDRRRYLIVVKKHPLEAEFPDLGNVKYVPNDAHVHDLLEACDKLVVLNSGTGVLAMCMNKPIIVCGNAFYAKGGLAYQARNAAELLNLAQQTLQVSEEANLRFIHYLKDSFYSFGRSQYVEKSAPNGARIRLCNKIDFSVIRGFGDGEINLGSVPEWIKPGSFLFRGVTGTNPYEPQDKSTNKSTNGASKPVRSEKHVFDEHVKKGCALYHEGDFVVAYQYFEKAMLIDPDNANLRRILSETLLKLDRRAEAIAHLEKAHTLMASNEAISRRLKHVKRPLLGLIVGAKPFPVPQTS